MSTYVRSARAPVVIDEVNWAHANRTMNFITCVSGTDLKKSKSNPVPIKPPIESIEIR